MRVNAALLWDRQLKSAPEVNKGAFNLFLSKIFRVCKVRNTQFLVFILNALVYMTLFTVSSNDCKLVTVSTATKLLPFILLCESVLKFNGLLVVFFLKTSSFFLHNVSSVFGLNVDAVCI